MIFLTALVLGGATLFILAPLLGWGGSPAFDSDDAASSPRQELLARRQHILAGIKDVEMEYEVGKLTKPDFEQTRESLTQEAIEVYRKLDSHGRG